MSSVSPYQSGSENERLLRGSIGSYTDAIACTRLVLIPVTPSSSKIVYGRTFVYTKDIDSDRKTKVLTVLESQLKRVEEVYTNTIHQTLQNLYQRSARRKDVESSHKKWKIELEKTWAEIKGDEAISRPLYDFIPLLTNPNKQAQALSVMMKLEVMRHSLKRTWRELILILSSEHHQAALIFYKNKIKECEALTSKPNVEARVDGLALLFEEIKANVATVPQKLERQPNLVVQETLQLYKELLEFVEYARRTFKKEAKDLNLDYESKGTIIKRLKKLHTAIKKESDAIHIATPRIQPVEQLDDGVIKAFIKKASKHSLNPKYDFKNGMWFATSPLLYGEIKTQILELQNTAKALVQVLETVKERLSQVLAGAVSADEALVNEYERYYALVTGIMLFVELQRKSLAEMPLCKSVHAGLHYVAQQVALGNEARMYIRQLSQLTRGRIPPYITAINHVITYLNRKGTHTAIDTLYQAVASACNFIPTSSNKESFTATFCKIASVVLDDTLALAAPQTLKLTSDERTIPKSIFSRTLFSNSSNTGMLIVLPNACRSYLTKKFMTMNHFSSEAIDPELDAILYMLSTDPLYKVHFTETLVFDLHSNFKTLFEAYTKKSDAQDHAQAIAMMVDVLSELHTNPQEALAVKRQRYYKMKQLLWELGQQHSKCLLEGQSERFGQQKLRLEWILAATKDPIMDLEQTLQIPIRDQEFRVFQADNSPSQKLYALLLQGVSATDPAVRVAASEKLALELAGKDFTELASDSIIGPLFMRWSFEQFQSLGVYTPIEILKLLTGLFKEYLSNLEYREFWQKEYGVGAMEQALGAFTEVNNWQLEDLHPVIWRKRGKKHFDLWKNTIRIYEQCTKDNVHACLKKVQSYFEDAGEDSNGELGNANIQPLSSHLSISRKLMQLMQQQAFKVKL